MELVGNHLVHTGIHKGCGVAGVVCVVQVKNDSIGVGVNTDLDGNTVRLLVRSTILLTIGTLVAVFGGFRRGHSDHGGISAGEVLVSGFGLSGIREIVHQTTGGRKLGTVRQSEAGHGHAVKEKRIVLCVNGHGITANLGPIRTGERFVQGGLDMSADGRPAAVFVGQNLQVHGGGHQRCGHRVVDDHLIVQIKQVGAILQRGVDHVSHVAGVAQPACFVGDAAIRCNDQFSTVVGGGCNGAFGQEIVVQQNIGRVIPHMGQTLKPGDTRSKRQRGGFGVVSFVGIDVLIPQGGAGGSVRCRNPVGRQIVFLALLPIVTGAAGGTVSQIKTDGDTAGIWVHSDGPRKSGIGVVVDGQVDDHLVHGTSPLGHQFMGLGNTGTFVGNAPTGFVKFSAAVQ